MVSYIRKFPLVSFFVLTFVINWAGIAALVAGVFPTFGEWPLYYDGQEIERIRGRRTLLVWAPNIAAAIVVGVSGGWHAVRQLFRQFLIWRVDPRWWLAAFFVPVGLAALAVVFFGLSGGTVDLSQSYHLIGIFAVRFLFSLTTGGIGEEAGWRGFALPRLQTRIGALGASVVIGLIWGLWHMAFWSLRGLETEYVIVFMISVVSLSIILSWIYNSTRGSLLLVALAHTVVNAVEATASRSFAAVIPSHAFMDFFAAVLFVFAFCLVACTKGRLGFSHQTTI